jgi:type VI secretion system protein ImpF
MHLHKSRHTCPVLERFNIDEKANSQSVTLSQNEYKEIIRKDLHLLLNSTSINPRIIHSNDHAKSSGLFYGYYDPWDQHGNHRITKDKLCQIIEDIITKHERRLTHIEVSLSEERSQDGMISINIQGQLSPGVLDQSILFESTIETSKKIFTISQGF